MALLFSPLFKFLVRLFATGVFVLVILTRLFGSQFAEANLSTVLTWTIW
jgi:hypothetical protein